MKKGLWGVSLRDEGIERTEEAEGEEWFACAESVTRAFAGKTAVPWDTIRLFIHSKCGDPHHPNCWGALTMRLLRAGVLKDTVLTKNSSIPSRRAGRIRLFDVH